ncbi:DUF3891 domain-containing protein [Opitutaceae bacterium EW11]|nr:DUF3891 domain-containing protein [Opitutaceae bacterium EW11]
MLRIETADGWILIEHRDHARLAGRFAEHWGNDDFAPPEPFPDVHVAVSRHDDAWAERDALPCLTREGRPSAFSKELVGKYSAFEEIDLLDYLAVRGRATEAVAAENPFAALLISMHTVNLLTDQADLSGLSPAEREAHGRFVEAQKNRQLGLAQRHLAGGGVAPHLEPASLRRAFAFLQACDHLSLLACVGHPEPTTLRHAHPARDGTMTTLRCVPQGNSTYRLDPYPFDRDHLEFSVPARFLPGRSWRDQEAFRADCRAARTEPVLVRIVS